MAVENALLFRAAEDRAQAARVLAVFVTGLPSSAFETGSWADVAGLVGGNWLRAGLVLGGMVSGFGIFNALVMSYTRLPLAMGQDGMLPRVFAKVHPKTKAPWVAILACAAGWAVSGNGGVWVNQKRMKRASVSLVMVVWRSRRSIARAMS